MFKTELETFNRDREKWIREGRKGQWVVIHGTDVLGFYPGLEEAYNAGAEKFEPGTFLAKRITKADQIETIQRAFFTTGT